MKSTNKYQAGILGSEGQSCDQDHIDRHTFFYLRDFLLWGFLDLCPSSAGASAPSGLYCIVLQIPSIAIRIKYAVQLYNTDEKTGEIFGLTAWRLVETCTLSPQLWRACVTSSASITWDLLVNVLRATVDGASARRFEDLSTRDPHPFSGRVSSTVARSTTSSSKSSNIPSSLHIDRCIWRSQIQVGNMKVELQPSRFKILTRRPLLGYLQCTLNWVTPECTSSVEERAATWNFAVTHPSFANYYCGRHFESLFQKNCRSSKLCLL